MKRVLIAFLILLLPIFAHAGTWITFGEWSDPDTCVVDAGSTNTSLITGELTETAANFYRGMYVTGGSGIDGGPVLVTASSEAAGVNTLTVEAGLTSVAENDEFTIACRYTSVTEDMFVQGGTNSGENHGASNSLQIKDYVLGGNNARASFIKFDLSGGPGGTPTINTAELMLYYVTNDGAMVTRVNICTRDWGEGNNDGTACDAGESSWDQYDCATGWGATHDQSTELDTFTLDGTGWYTVASAAAFKTEVLAKWAGTLNVSIKSEVDAYGAAWSLDAAATEGRPFLRVEYTPAATSQIIIIGN